MAKKSSPKRSPASAEEAELERGLPALERIASLLAIIATKGMETDAAAVRLDAIGMTGREIGTVLGVSADYAKGAKFRAKNGKPKKKAS
jgi:hypothetical protein